jgi:hypothetical protein
MTMTVNQSDNYKVWIEMMGKGDSANSLFLQLDGLYCVKVGDFAGMPSSTWTWVDYQNGNTATKIPMPLIAAGTHTITLIGNAAEKGVAVRRILLTKDTTCVPVGTGDACVGVVSTPTPTVTPTQVVPTPTESTSENILENPSFDSTANVWLSPWYTNVYSDARATFTRDSVNKVDGTYSMNINIKDVSPKIWHVQLSHPIAIHMNTSYKFSFYAKASKARKINFTVQSRPSPFTTYFDKSVLITTDWKKYELTFSSKIEDPNSALRLNVGNISGKVWFDHVGVSRAAFSGFGLY